MLERKDRNIGLDLIRAMAISLVVISHCSYLLGVNDDHPLTLIVRATGALGVDLFFVLSGYLIGGLILNELESGRDKWANLIHFWKRRWLRTLPNYFLVLALNVIVIIAFGGTLPGEIIAYIVFLQNFITPHPEFFSEAWSLSVEEYAYLILPFLLYLASQKFRNFKPKQVYLWTVIITISVLGMIKFIYLANTDFTGYFSWSAGFRKVVLYRMDSIYFGFLIIYLMRFHRKLLLQRRGSLFILGLFLLFVAHLPLLLDILSPRWSNFFFSIIYINAVIIGMGLTFPLIITFESKLTLRKLIYWVSTRSYAIYLVNYSLIQLSLLKLCSHCSVNVINSILKLFFYLAFTIVFSEVIYRYFEYPILKWRNRKVPRIME